MSYWVRGKTQAWVNWAEGRATWEYAIHAMSGYLENDRISSVEEVDGELLLATKHIYYRPHEDPLISEMLVLDYCLQNSLKIPQRV